MNFYPYHRSIGQVFTPSISDYYSLVPTPILYSTLWHPHHIECLETVQRRATKFLVSDQSLLQCQVDSPALASTNDGAENVRHNVGTGLVF